MARMILKLSTYIGLGFAAFLGGCASLPPETVRQFSDQQLCAAQNPNVYRPQTLQMIAQELSARGIADCSPAGLNAHIQARIQARIDAECRPLSTAVDRIGCADAVERKEWGTVAYPDLMDLRRAWRLRIAEAVDRGEISASEGEVQLAELQSRIAQMAIERYQSERTASAAEMQAQAANRASSVQMMNLGLRLLQPPPTVTCTTFGGITTCR